MSKGDWPGKPEPNKDEQERNLAATDPKALQDSIRAIVGEVVGAQLAEAVTRAMKDAGVTQADRKYLRFPEIASRCKGMSALDVCDTTPWGELPGDQRGQRRAALNAFFRQAFTGVSIGAQLGDEADPALVRALSTTDADGGYLIPPGFIPEITRDIPKLSQLFQYVRVMPVSGDSGTMPAVGTNATVTWGDTEGATMTDNSRRSRSRRTAMPSRDERFREAEPRNRQRREPGHRAGRGQLVPRGDCRRAGQDDRHRFGHGSSAGSVLGERHHERQCDQLDLR